MTATDDGNENENENENDADESALTVLDKALEFLINRRKRPDHNDRVQFALDQLAVAACERAARVFRSDVATGASDG